MPSRRQPKEERKNANTKNVECKNEKADDERNFPYIIYRFLSQRGLLCFFSPSFVFWRGACSAVFLMKIHSRLFGERVRQRTRKGRKKSETIFVSLAISGLILLLDIKFLSSSPGLTLCDDKLLISPNAFALFI